VKNRRSRTIQVTSERGQSLTEFALALPILALLLFAVIQFGIVFNNYVTLTDATRAGARKGAAVSCSSRSKRASMPSSAPRRTSIPRSSRPHASRPGCLEPT